jgi:hypothetical protein
MRIGLCRWRACGRDEKRQRITLLSILYDLSFSSPGVDPSQTIEKARLTKVRMVLVKAQAIIFEIKNFNYSVCISALLSIG